MIQIRETTGPIINVFLLIPFFSSTNVFFFIDNPLLREGIKNVIKKIVTVSTCN